MHKSQVSIMGFDVITQMKALNAELQETCGGEHCGSVTLLGGDGHGVRPQQLCIVTVIDEAQRCTNTICEDDRLNRRTQLIALLQISGQQYEIFLSM